MRGTSVFALICGTVVQVYLHSVTAQDLEIDPPDQVELGMFRF